MVQVNNMWFLIFQALKKNVLYWVLIALINCIFSTRTCSPLRPGRSFATSSIAAMTCNAKKHPRLRLSLLPFICFFAHWAPAAFVRHVIPHRRGFVRMAAGEAKWWCQLGGINAKLQTCFQVNMQSDAVPLLKDYETYEASLPVRELAILPPVKLYQLPFYVRECDLDGFATNLTKSMQRPTVAYVAAASHSGKSASVLVGFLRAREQSTLDGQRSMNFSHYLYMPFANNGGNNHDSVDEDQLEKACGKSTRLREALGASYMKDCFKAQAFGQRFRFLRRLLHLHCEPTRYRYLLKSCPVCFIACKPSGKGFLEVVPFKPLHGDSPHPTYRPKDLDVLCLAAFRWCLCCGG